MAEEFEDLREVAWHPRFANLVVGHGGARQDFISAFASGRPHHAWLVTGPVGIGKATLAYDLAQHVLAQSGNRGPGPALAACACPPGHGCAGTWPRRHQAAQAQGRNLRR